MLPIGKTKPIICKILAEEEAAKRKEPFSFVLDLIP